MNDVRVTSWIELIQALCDIPQTSHQRHRSSFVCRGVADQRWRLETSLSRLGAQYAEVEKPLLRGFGKYAEPGSIPGGDSPSAALGGAAARPSEPVTPRARTSGRRGR
jgi:hypothetical protein